MLGVVVWGTGGDSWVVAAAVIYAAIMSGVTGSQGSMMKKGSAFHKFLMKHNKRWYEKRQA